MSAVEHVDAVCGMKISEAAAAGSIAYNGELYFFCSTGCLRLFQVDPGEVRSGIGESRAPQSRSEASAGQAKDPICGMLVSKQTALRTERGGRARATARRLATGGVDVRLRHPQYLGF